jgi:hypothetical protein
MDDRDSLAFVSDLLHIGDRVVARFTWKGEGRGPAMDFELTVAYTIRGGRILNAEFFPEHNEALEAAGLSE